MAFVLKSQSPPLHVLLHRPTREVPWFGGRLHSFRDSLDPSCPKIYSQDLHQSEMQISQPHLSKSLISLPDV